MGYFHIALESEYRVHKPRLIPVLPPEVVQIADGPLLFRYRLLQHAQGPVGILKMGWAEPVTYFYLTYFFTISGDIEVLMDGRNPKDVWRVAEQSWKPKEVLMIILCPHCHTNRVLC